MWVIGDRARRVKPRQALRALTATLRDVESAPSGAERHERLTSAFIQAGELAQGIADEAFETHGCDHSSAAQDAAMALVVALARKLAASAWSAHSTVGPPTSAELMALALSALPDEVEVKTPEGYAFYSLMPEAYLKAAAEQPWASPPLVIGIRSIGTGLAGLVAAVTQAPAIVTLRPAGHALRRDLRVSDALQQKLAGHAGPFAVVDEGPGVSGSSFAAVAALLEGMGVAAERIVFLPSHAGEPGPEALPEVRDRWRGAERRPASFERLVEEEPVTAWFEDLVGPVSAVEALSGGAWARSRPDAPPTHAAFERRKYRLTTAGGDYLAKFAGLGEIGQAKLARARTLFRAGAGAEPIGLRRGFLVERWVEGAPGLSGDRASLVEHLGRYLGLRALAFPAEAEAGASLEDLAVMTRTNVAELLGDEAAAALPPPPDASKSRPAHVDGRLHAWEWITTPEGRLIKTDAVDHSCGHDLVGCQDIAWDVAAAAVEFGLEPAEIGAICKAVTRVCEREVDRDLLAFHRLAYPAFQAGLWTLAGDEAQVARYRGALAAVLP